MGVVEPDKHVLRWLKWNIWEFSTLSLNVDVLFDVESCHFAWACRLLLTFSTKVYNGDSEWNDKH